MLLVSAYLDATIKDPNKIVGPLIQEIVDITDAQKWGLLIGSDCNAHSPEVVKININDIIS
jgi:hypothetical protein